MKNLTHKQIMSRIFKCDDDIWRGVYRYISAKSAYIMILPGPDGKNQFQEIKNTTWFNTHKSEVKK